MSKVARGMRSWTTMTQRSRPVDRIYSQSFGVGLDDDGMTLCVASNACATLMVCTIIPLLAMIRPSSGGFRMSKPLAPIGVGGATRRHFVKQLGALCGLASLSLVTPLQARTHERRAVSFVHTHTGEKLTAHYFAGGCYQPHCLQQVDHLLRDFRTGEVHQIGRAHV